MRVAVGDSLPTIQFGPITRATLAYYSSASGDHNPMHIDSDAAKAAGFDDVFAPGMLSFGVLARVPEEWAGLERLRSIKVRFVSATRLHEIVTCSGEVAELFEWGGERCARIAISASVQDGRLTLVGDAVVTLD